MADNPAATPDGDTRHYSFSIYADHYAFYLEDAELGELYWQTTSPYSKDSDSQWVNRIGTGRGFLNVITSCYDTVQVEVLVFSSQPSLSDFDEWDHIVEASIELPSGKLYFRSPLDPPDEDLAISVTPGSYRIIICYYGMDTMTDFKEEGEEFYKILLWPGEPVEPRILKRHLREVLLQKYGVSRETARALFEELERRYAAEGRYYHTFKHIFDMLQTLQAFKDEISNLEIVQLATWFHDAIYDTRANDNEEKSAEYAGRVLGEVGVPGEVIGEVQRLVLDTKTHTAPEGDIGCQYFLDADLQILGQPPGYYGRYAEAIRKEYAWVPEDHYRAGRKKVLESFLRRDRLYYTDKMYQNYEWQARQNLKREIEALN